MNVNVEFIELGKEDEEVQKVKNYELKKTNKKMKKFKK